MGVQEEGGAAATFFAKQGKKQGMLSETGPTFN
jgi:hypothetical protein